MTEDKKMFVVDGRNLLFTFMLVSSLFLLWGFCNGMIDVMDKHFQEELHLSKAQSAWVQFAHYLGYFMMSLPAGWLAVKLGYKGGIIAGLLIVALGGVWFVPATHINAMALQGQVSRNTAFVAFLAGVCLIATGLTFLETIANPYTTVLGDKRFAATRINLAQSCNGVGWILGPIVGGETGADSSSSEWSHPHFAAAVAAQFFYVAAQAGIFSFFINYMTSEVPPIPAAWNHSWLSGWFEANSRGVLAVSDKGASNLASLGFLLFLIGRFSGARILKRFAASRVLGVYALCSVIVSLMVFSRLGWLSVACVFASYFFMSIMFPTIFALGIFGLGARSRRASAYLVMAIMGGAIVPKLMGWVADEYDMSRGFIVPVVCFAFVALYAFMWPRLSRSRSVANRVAADHFSDA